MPRRKWLVLGMAVLVGMAGCDDVPTGGGGDEDDRPAGPSEVVTGDVTATQRIETDLRVSGAFRPGVPLVFTATARAKYQASDVEFDLLVLDDDGTADAAARGLGRAVGTARGAMGKGVQRQLTATVTFARPGYYRVAAVAHTRPGEGDPERAADSVFIELSADILYILVDEQGGRLTEGFDPQALGNRNPAYGSWGPFIPGRTGGGAASLRLSGTMASAVGGQHVLWYENLEAPKNPDGSVALRPVPSALVKYDCLNSSYQVVSSDSLRSAADGSFTIPCASGLYNASAFLRSSVAHVTNRDSTNAGVLRFFEYWPTDLKVNNGHAAQAYRLLNRYGPIAHQRFGRSRGQVTVRVSNVKTDTIGTAYYTDKDVITLDEWAVFAQYGRFATVHEYGHAYHWTAIEPWVTGSPYCNAPNGHEIYGQYSANCAFVEGFADFFGSWIAGDSLFAEPSYSDWRLETQTFYAGGKDGAKVEGAFAGFLYDLVDGTAEPDGYYNESGGDDASFFDGVTYPASFIANSMRSCIVTGASGTPYDFLYSSYELIYCLENRLNSYTTAQSLGWTWVRYSAVSRGVADPVGFNADAITRLWRANLYGK